MSGQKARGLNGKKHRLVGMGILAGIFLSAQGIAPVRAAENLNSVIVYPNPVRAYAGNQTLTFFNLTEQADIKIIDLEGNVILDISLEDTAAGYRWDLLNGAGDPVASGVYVYQIRNNAGEERTGKIAIIR